MVIGSLQWPRRVALRVMYIQYFVCSCCLCASYWWLTVSTCTLVSVLQYFHSSIVDLVPFSLILPIPDITCCPYASNSSSSCFVHFLFIGLVYCTCLCVSCMLCCASAAIQGHIAGARKVFWCTSNYIEKQSIYSCGCCWPQTVNRSSCWSLKVQWNLITSPLVSSPNSPLAMPMLRTDFLPCILPH